MDLPLLKLNSFSGLLYSVVYLSHQTEEGKTLIERLLRTPSKQGIGTSGGQQVPTVLVVYAKFQFSFTTTIDICSSNILLVRGSGKAFNEGIGVSNFFPSVV